MTFIRYIGADFKASGLCLLYRGVHYIGARYIGARYIRVRYTEEFVIRVRYTGEFVIKGFVIPGSSL